MPVSPRNITKGRADDPWVFNTDQVDADFVVKGLLSADAAGDLLHVDAANGRVGIGTSTPSSLFHVDGALRCTSLLVDSGTTEWGDDALLTLGNDNDQVLLNRSTSLSANTAVTSAIVGTPVVAAIPANSLIISNVTADGDQVLIGQTGGNSTEWLRYDASATAVIFNEGSADLDFRFESNALSNFLVMDGNACLNGQIAIGGAVPTNPQALFSILPAVNATGVTANQSYFHSQLLPGAAVTIPTGTAPVVASMNIHEPNITATGTVTDAATVRIVDAPTEGGTGNYALWVDAGLARLDGSSTLGALTLGAAAPTNPQAFFAIVNPANASGVTANQSYFIQQVLPGGATTVPAGTAPVVASLNVHEPNITATGTVTDAATVRIVDAPTEGSANWALWVDAGAARFDGTAYIGDTANATVTLGLTINQDGNDDSILELKSSDVAHGVTTVTETDTYALFRKYVAANGGLEILGIEDTGDTGLALTGVAVTANATRSTSGAGAIMLKGHLKSGTGLASIGADKNILTVSDNGTVRFILDTDGDSFQDVGTAWTNYDVHDDLVLLNSLAANVARPDNPIGEQFGSWLQVNKQHLEGLGLVHFNEDTDSRPFVNMSKLTMLLVGAVRQIGQQLSETRQALAELGQNALPAVA